MWLEEAEEFLKGFFPCYLLLFLPIFIIVSPAHLVAASHEFPVYRMQHYDLHGIAHGCRSAAVSLEARSLTGWSTTRHGVVVKLQDLTVDHFRNIRNKAGALLVIIPEDLSTLTKEEKEHLLILEDAMLAQEIMIPVYFAKSTVEIEKIANDIKQSAIIDDKTKSAAESIVNSIAANGYQIVLNSKTPNAKTDIKVASIQGYLSGTNHEGKTSTIVIVAYYDSYGVAPDLSLGADSNGSGVAMLLELIRLFSNLYSDPKTHGKYNIVFLLSGAGKFNYQGSKKWLEDQLDTLDGSLVQEASYVMCLDTLTSNDSIYMHVSKPPKENAPAATFFSHLKNKAEQFTELHIDGVHKKINLADDILAWEHERYSIRRLPAFTLSSLKTHKDSRRGTILDVNKSVDMQRLVRHTKVVAEAIASQIYNITSGNIFGGTLDVSPESMQAWINYLSSQPRAAQLLATKDNSLVTLLKNSFNKYLRDVRITHAVPDKRDPDFLFYDVTKGSMNVYSVKPAIFDLILTLAIIVYLGSVYLIVQKFPSLYSAICSITASKKKAN